MNLWSFNMIEKNKDFLRRNITLAFLGMVSIWFLKLEIPEIRALLFAVTTEILAIVFAGISAFVFTNVKFTENPQTPNLGLIFLAVHICIGLTLLSVYLAQFGG